MQNRRGSQSHETKGFLGIRNLKVSFQVLQCSNPVKAVAHPEEQPLAGFHGKGRPGPDLELPIADRELAEGKESAQWVLFGFAVRLGVIDRPGSQGFRRARGASDAGYGDKSVRLAFPQNREGLCSRTPKAISTVQSAIGAGFPNSGLYVQLTWLELEPRETKEH